MKLIEMPDFDDPLAEYETLWQDGEDFRTEGTRGVLRCAMDDSIWLVENVGGLRIYRVDFYPRLDESEGDE